MKAAPTNSVMPGLVPGVHDFASEHQNVDGRAFARRSEVGTSGGKASARAGGTSPAMTAREFIETGALRLELKQTLTSR